MHYSWSTEARARRALANISALLRPGGILIGTMPDANVIVKKLRAGFFLPYYFLQINCSKFHAIIFLLNFKRLLTVHTKGRSSCLNFQGHLCSAL